MPASRDGRAMIVFAVTLLASLFGSAAQTTVGFGAALFLSPVMFLLLGPEAAVVCTLASVTGLSVIVLFAERRQLALEPRVTIGLLAPAIPGVFLGALLLGVVDEAYLQIAVGLVVLAFVASRPEITGRRGVAPLQRLVYRRSAIPAGLAAGALNGAISTGGPPLAIWLRSRGASRTQLRHTLAVVFIFINLTSIAVIAVVDAPVIGSRWLVAFAGGLAGVPCGYWLGSRVLGLIDERIFARGVAIALSAVAIASLSSGALAL